MIKFKSGMVKRFLAVLLAAVALASILFSASIFSIFAKDPLAGAEQRIQKYRMADASIRIFDADGNPLKSAQVLVEQQAHDFLFGCAAHSYFEIQDPKEKDIYFRQWKDVFNLAVVPVYWKPCEPEPGRSRESEMRPEFQPFLENKVALLGHPLIDTNEIGNPKWLKITPALEDQIQTRVQKVVQDFPEVKGWVVMNEPIVGWDPFPTDAWVIHRGNVEATRLALSWAREKNPHATLIVNNYLSSQLLDIIGVISKFGVIESFRLFRRLPRRPSYFEFLTQLKDADALPDAIGIQSHMHTIEWPLWFADRVIDKYRKIGRPVYFTEITILSGPPLLIDWAKQYGRNDWPRNPEKEKSQAEYAEKFYTLLFSRPEVSAIIWNDFTDRFAHPPAPAGLLRNDLSPKPAYFTLRHLIREKWWTRARGRTDDQGGFKFSGFYGNYQVTVATADGRSQIFELSLRKLGPKDFIFQLR